MVTQISEDVSKGPSAIMDIYFSVLTTKSSKSQRQSFPSACSTDVILHIMRPRQHLALQEAPVSLKKHMLAQV